VKFFLSYILILILISSSYSGILPDNAFSKEARGSVTANFLKNYSSARFASLGNTGSTFEGADSIFYNPAGSNFPFYSSALYLGYQKLLEESYRMDFAYIFKGEKIRNGFGLIYNSYGQFEKLDSMGKINGSFSPADYAFNYSLSFDIKEMSYGFNFKIIQSDLVYKKGYSLAIDAGLISHSNKKDMKDYSLVIRNLGIPMKLGDKVYPLPFEIVGGLKYPYSENFNILLEAKFPSDDNPYISGGTEFIIPFDKTNLFLRAGYNSRNSSSLGFRGSFTAGLGLSFTKLSIDYAYLPYGDIGDTHRMTFSYLFGKNNIRNEEDDIIKKSQTQFLKDKKFVVIGFSTENITENYANIIANNLENLIWSRNYKVISRLDIKFLKLSKGFTFSDDKSYNDFCEKIEADYCIYGNIKKEENSITYIVKLYSVNSRYLIKSFGIKAANEYKFKEVVKKIADECLNSD